MTESFAFDLGDWFSRNESRVRGHLERYFAGNSGDRFTGRWFETFAARGNPTRFEPSDILAVESLSVEVPTESAAKLLLEDFSHYNDLLAEIPQEIDLWGVEKSVVEPGGAADKLHRALDDLRQIGWVTAGKLVAAKRPRLIPILDKEVKALLKPAKGRFWVTMYDQLADESRRQRIAEVCSGAPDGVSLLRRIDVALWMHATQQKRQ